MKNYYEILGLEEKCTKEQIKKAYHKTALKYHPDKNKNTENLFKDTVEAYEVLYDDRKKRKYDLSRKMKEDYKFVLPPEILNFSKYFFSKENINKFSDFASIINQGINKFSMEAKFENLFNMLLERIRNNNITDLYKEYKDFKKFYDINDTYKSKNTKENKIVKKVNIPCEKKVKTLDRNKILNNKDIIVNIKVSLDNIFNNIIKVVNLEVDEKCSLCNGTGLLEKDDESNILKNKNSRNKRKKNRSRKKKEDNFLEKVICNKCSGTMFCKKQRKFTIDTSVDKICYQKCYFLNNEEGYVDIIFNIIPKEHFINRVGRYDLSIDYNISLYEMYFGGYFNLNYIDGKKYKMIWEGFGNNNFENSRRIEHMGLSIKNEEAIKIRGDLIINFKLILPKFEELISYSNIDMIKELFSNKDIKNNLGNQTKISEEVTQYNIVKIT